MLWQTGCTPVDDLPIVADAVPARGGPGRGAGRADIVISHAGTGSALANLACGPVRGVASRVAALGEAGDDHQQELAEELAARGLAAAPRP